MVGSKVIIFALALISYTTWVQANDTENNWGNDIPSVANLTSEDVSYVVALVQNNITIGSGSILHQVYVLTSASAVERAYNNTFQIVVGKDGFYRSGHPIDVEQHICHENHKGHENDICLLKLKTAVTKWTNTGKIDIPKTDSPLSEATFVDITGWGLMENELYTGQLQRTHIQLSKQSQCNSTNHDMNSNKICASTKGLGVYWGNTGAPMTIGNLQIGVAAGNGNCVTDHTVYTKVSKYASWIKERVPGLGGL